MLLVCVVYFFEMMQSMLDLFHVDCLSVSMSVCFFCCFSSLGSGFCMNVFSVWVYFLLVLWEKFCILWFCGLVGIAKYSVFVRYCFIGEMVCIVVVFCDVYVWLVFLWVICCYC